MNVIKTSSAGPVASLSGVQPIWLNSASMLTVNTEHSAWRKDEVIRTCSPQNLLWLDVDSCANVNGFKVRLNRCTSLVCCDEFARWPLTRMVVVPTGNSYTGVNIGNCGVNPIAIYRTNGTTRSSFYRPMNDSSAAWNPSVIIASYHIAHRNGDCSSATWRAPAERQHGDIKTGEMMHLY